MRLRRLGRDYWAKTNDWKVSHEEIDVQPFNETKIEVNDNGLQTINVRNARYEGGVRVFLGQIRDASGTRGSDFWLDLSRDETLEMAEKLVATVRSQMQEKSQ